MVQPQLAHPVITNSRTLSNQIARRQTTKRAFYTLGAATLLTFGALALAPRNAHAERIGCEVRETTSIVQASKPTEHKHDVAAETIFGLLLTLPILGSLTGAVAAYAILRG